MKIRAVLILVGLAIIFALPAFAQEKEEVNPFPFRSIAASPQIVQQLEAINLKFDEAFNQHDATAAAALFTANAIQVTPVGQFSGREAIGKYFADLFQRFNVSIPPIGLQKSVMSMPLVAICAPSEGGR